LPSTHLHDGVCNLFWYISRCPRWRHDDWQ
jgi:hypothetical protein